MSTHLRDKAPQTAIRRYGKMQGLFPGCLYFVDQHLKHALFLHVQPEQNSPMTRFETRAVREVGRVREPSASQEVFRTRARGRYINQPLTCPLARMD